MFDDFFHDEVRIVPYQEEWDQRFQEMKERITDILWDANIECDVRHVGSTSIHGMCSKPIVDILVMVDEEDMEIAPHALAHEMYCLGECGRPGRYFFSDGDTEHDAAYIHLTTSDNQVAIDQLAFQDMLRASAELRKQYAELKMQLAAKYPDNRDMYRQKKGIFIEKCLEEGHDVQGD